jgi:hypothetical protein
MQRAITNLDTAADQLAVNVCALQTSHICNLRLFGQRPIPRSAVTAGEAG